MTDKTTWWTVAPFTSDLLKSPVVLPRYEELLKRIVDLVISLLGLILCAPLFLAIAFLIKRSSSGPLLYRGPRMGRYGKVFGILKFRTMVEDPASYAGPRITAQGDARITPIGRWLRDTKLNELPQLWNVFKGDMSLVGPRPEDPEIVATWSEEVRREILSIRPGITSPASVLYRNEEAMLDREQVMESYFASIMPSKLRLDQLYVRYRSLWGDLDILLWTGLVVIVRSLVPTENLLLVGPIENFVRRNLTWFIIDGLITFLGIGVAGLVWRSFGPLDVGFPAAWIVALGFAVLFSLLSAVLRLDRISWRHADASDMGGIVVSSVLAAVFALWINTLAGSRNVLPPAMILFASALSLIGFVVARYRSRLISRVAIRWLEGRSVVRAARERVLIVGSGYTGQFMTWLLKNSFHANVFELVGFVDDDLYKQGMRFQGITVVGKRDRIPEWVKRHDVGVIFFAIHNISSQERQRILDICLSTAARVAIVPNVLEYLGIADALSPERQMWEGAPTSHLAKEKMLTWLNDLDQEAQTGDLTVVRANIQAMQEEIRALRNH